MLSYLLQILQETKRATKAFKKMSSVTQMLGIIKFIILALWSSGGYSGYFWYPILPK